MASIDGTKLKEYLTCPRIPFLAFHLGKEQEQPPTPMLEVLFRSGYRVEARLLEEYAPEEADFSPGDFEAGFQATLDLIDRKVPAISNGVLKLGEFLGRPDLLLLNEQAGWYEVADIKSTHKVHASALLQVGFYSRLLGQVRPAPKQGLLILRDGRQVRFDLEDHAASVEYLLRTLQRFRDQRSADPEAHRVEACLDCRYRLVCDDELESRRDLSLTPGLTRAQARALRAAGLDNLDDLAALERPEALFQASGLAGDLLRRLSRRARAVVEGRLLRFDRNGEQAAQAGFGLAALFSERQGDPAVAVAGQVFGDLEKFRVRFLRRPEAADPETEFRELLINLRGSKGPILVYGESVIRCLDHLAARQPAQAGGLEKVRERLVDLRSGLRRSIALPGLDRTAAQAASAAGLAPERAGADEDLELEVLRYLEEETEAHQDSIERLLRRDLMLIAQLRELLLAKGNSS